MKDVIVVEKSEWKTNNFVLACLGLLCVVFGYFLAGMQVGAPKSVQPLSPATAMEKWTALALQQSKAGDFAITKYGRVLRLSESSQKKVVEGDRVYYNTRMTLGGHFEKPLWQMAALVVEVISPTSESYAVITQCFYKGKVVTTVGPEKLTCT